MLISVSGSQGSGKTTCLNEIKSRGYNVIERKTSRSILSDWNVTLDEVNTNPELTIKFQEEILQRKYSDEIEASLSKDLWFTERTCIDLMVYATISIGKENKHAEWLDAYCRRCVVMTKGLYSYNFYIKGGMFKIQKDGVRGYSEFYGQLVDDSMYSVYTRYLNERYTLISVLDVNNRVREIFNTLKYNNII